MRPAILCALALALALPATAQTGVATVEFDDQTSDGMTVVVQQVTLSNGGFIAIHESVNGSAGPVIGHSDYLSVGTHDDVVVNITLGQGVTGNVTLIAMPHVDSNDNQEYDFDTSGGQDDGPYSDGGAAVVDSASITIESGETEGAGRDNGDDEDAPAFAVVAGIAALAAVALLVRRRS